jgi:hypothetical protein
MRLVDNIFNSMVGKGETEPYTYYDYLESDGNGQYIDTGVIVGGNCSIEINYIWLSQGGGNTSIWTCGGQDSSSLAYRMRSVNSRLQSRYFNSDYGSNSVFLFQHGYSYQRHKNVITYYDGVNVFYTGTPALRLSSSAYTHYLFSVNNAGTPAPFYSPVKIRLGRVRIYDDNDVLVRDFRPAVRKADGVAGMLDIVNDVFYPSANGVNFLYGNF